MADRKKIVAGVMNRVAAPESGQPEPVEKSHGQKFEDGSSFHQGAPGGGFAHPGNAVPEDVASALEDRFNEEYMAQARQYEGYPREDTSADDKIDPLTYSEGALDDATGFTTVTPFDPRQMPEDHPIQSQKAIDYWDIGDPIKFKGPDGKDWYAHAGVHGV